MKILIITNEFDYPISTFFKYLLKYNLPFQRENGNYPGKDVEIEWEINNDFVQNRFRLNRFIYYRKSPIYKVNIYNKLSTTTENYFKDQIKQLKDDIFQDSCRPINNNLVLGKNNFGLRDISKIQVLIKASQIGLKIPDTLVTSSLTILKDFVKKHTVIISKSLTNAVFIKDIKQDKTFTMYTKKYTMDDIPNIESNIIFPSLIQKYINKLFEIRVYILGNSIYPMAIFSQQNQKTNTDFRDHDFTNPNKIVPYILPKRICNNLIKLLRFFEMNNASIDLIYSTDKKIYFLEINPFGQFGHYAQCCNYNIEKSIINYIQEHEAN